MPFKIWSEFDLHVILEQKVSIPDYIDGSEELEDFISKCLAKEQKSRSGLNELRHHLFLASRVTIDPNPDLYFQMQAIL